MSNYELVKIKINISWFLDGRDANGEEFDAVIYDGTNAVFFTCNNYFFIPCTDFTKVPMPSNVEPSMSLVSPDKGASILSAIGDKPSKITIEF